MLLGNQVSSLQARAFLATQAPQHLQDLEKPCSCGIPIRALFTSVVPKLMNERRLVCVTPMTVA